VRQILGFAVALTLATPASAWGDRGHRAIADITWTQLTPSARHQITELLAAAPALATPACSAGSFEDGATWADCVRSNYHERFAATSTWHYVDVSVCRPFKLPADPEGRFIVERYRREVAILRDRDRPLVERLEALFWVEHLVGDLHQPLHIGDAGDLGGNEVNVNPQSGRYPLNLHAEWDRVLVDDAVRETPGGVAGLAAASKGVAGRYERSPAKWARGTWEIAQTVAYGNSAIAGRCAGDKRQVEVGDDYRSAAVPIVEMQLKRAGVRLAAVLNEALK
jgi:hypothetical protein